MTRYLINPAVLLSTAVLLLSLIGFGRLQSTVASGNMETGPGKREHAMLSEQPSLKASAQGRPWISLGDGREVITRYSGRTELVEALDQNSALPLSLASADFDEDGVPDLVSGYAFMGGGILTIHRGNSGSIYAESPFLSSALVYEAPEGADFIGVGDFDGDGHRDVVAAAHGGSRLHLLCGDGRGNLSAARHIELGGKATSLIVGEINRRDGLDDVVVAVNTADEAKVLVFEGPEGALKSRPELFSMPEEVSSLALGRFNGEYTYDLAVAAGHRLIVVRGRDRRLSLDEERQSEVPQAEVSSRLFRSKLRSVVAGDFTGNHETDLAVLSEEGTVDVLSRAGGEGRKSKQTIAGWKIKPLIESKWDETSRLIRARTASAPFDSLVIVNSRSNQLDILTERESMSGGYYTGVLAPPDVESAPVVALPMHLNRDALSDLVILQRNQSAVTVAMTQPQSVFVVTNTNDSGNGSLRKAIIDANNNPGFDEIRFNIPGAGPHTISPTSALDTITGDVHINGYSQPGSSLNTLSNGNNAVLRIILSGASAGGADGLTITAGNCTIQGLVINRFNYGIHIQTNGNNVITGNFIGTDANGTASLGNSQGIRIQSSSSNNIGETAVAERNLISGNGAGVWIEGTGATGNQIRNNYIGTDRNGTAGLGNTDGIVLNGGAQNNMIGNTAAVARNVISGNTADDGILLSESGNLVLGNYIGPNVNGGNLSAGQRRGIRIINSSNNTIGGAIIASRNVISGNTSGITLASTNHLVQGNYIGLAADGDTALPNDTGVEVFFSSGNSIGGTGGARNVISGNAMQGIKIFSNASGVVVQRNFIGINAGGTAARSNGIGIYIDGGSGNTIGGTTSPLRNIISGNVQIGIFVFGSTATGNQILGNYIGADLTGTVDIGNGTGISIDASNNTVGGTGGAGNLISGNGTGIDMSFDTTGTTIQGNLIGTAADGTTSLGNSGSGVFVGGSGNVIGARLNPGGTFTGPGNTIAFNGGNGITAGLDTENTFFSNLIFSNAGGLQIEVFPPGVTTVRPTITSTNVSNNTITIIGFLDGDPDTDYWLDFYFSNPPCQSPNGGGQQRLTALPILFTTNALGRINFNIPLSYTFGSGFVNCHATRAGSSGGEFSDCFAVTACTAPAINSQPGNQTACAGSLASFTVGATGTSLSYQWRKNGSPLANGGNVSGVTTATLTINPASTGDAGSYDVVITNSCGNLTSNAASLTINAAPQITSHPAGISRCAGQSASFSVTATGADLTYQWRKNGNNIPGATSSNFNINPVSLNDAGSYDVVVSGSCNPPATSLPVGLVVEDAPAVTSDPVNRTVCEGGNATFTASANSASNTQWQESTDGGGSFSDIAGANSVSLTLTSVTAARNGNRYRAVFTNQCGSSATAAATLTVNIFTLSANSRSFAGNGGSGSVDVAVANGCMWQVTNIPSWITITSGGSGNGFGTVNYAVQVNGSATVRNATLMIAGKSYTVYQGINFSDVPATHPFYNEIGRLSARQVTLGCNATSYCPDDVVTRQQMAAFIIRALGDFNPPPPAQQRFLDVSPTNPFYAFIEQMAIRQITLGCGGGNYCPGDPVLRDQMAAFIIRALHPPGYIPPQPAQQRFSDVPPSNPFYAHIEEMAVRQITLGCGGGNYCPTLAVTRGQMAAFLVRAFNL